MRRMPIVAVLVPFCILAWMLEVLTTSYIALSAFLSQGSQNSNVRTVIIGTTFVVLGSCIAELGRVAHASEHDIR